MITAATQVVLTIDREDPYYHCGDGVVNRLGWQKWSREQWTQRKRFCNQSVLATLKVPETSLGATFLESLH